MKFVFSYFAAAAFAATAVCAHGQNVTFTGTARSSGSGYVEGESYTVSFMISEDWETGGFRTVSINETPHDIYEWKQSSAEHDPLFSAIGGSAVSGSYIGDTAMLDVRLPSLSPVSMFRAGGEMEFDRSPIGLQTPDETNIIGIESSLSSGITFTLTDAPTDLNDYFDFAGLSGDYAITGILQIYMESDMPGMGFDVGFDLNNANFSPIPEPSTYAAILGVCALGLGLWRRRKTQRNRVLL